jgi:hypothetical protein
MFSVPDIIGVVSQEAIETILPPTAQPQRIIHLYRNFLEQRIESRYKVSCNIATAEQGRVQFRVNCTATQQLREQDLLQFEEECRQAFFNERVTSFN